jgi:hypothetical protein
MNAARHLRERFFVEIDCLRRRAKRSFASFSAPIPEVDSLRYPRRFVYRYNSPFSVSRQFNLISCMRKTLTGKIAAGLASPQLPRIDQISPKSCRA